MTTKTISNYAKAVNFGGAFYASDLGLNGGDINALRHHGLIRETGKTRTSYVKLYDNLAKEVIVSQWIVNPKAVKRIIKDARKTLDETQSLINTLEALV